MISAMKHFALLGLNVEDRVTGFKGVVECVSFDLYGCIQVTVRPGIDKDGKSRDGQWFDVARLKIISDKRVLDPPNFEFGPVSDGRKGPSEKPQRQILPALSK
jgi:hypothetical protein